MKQDCLCMKGLTKVTMVCLHSSKDFLQEIKMVAVLVTGYTEYTYILAA